MPTVARADDSTPDQTLAEVLFREGKRLMMEQKYAEACPKLAESHRLDPGGGTILNLAACHELEGKTASAWGEFREAAAAARRDGRADREAVATEHLSALEPKLHYLVIRVAGPSEEVETELDGHPVPRAAWGTPFPVDPGTHTLRAHRDGYEPREIAVESRAEAGTQQVDVAPLVALPKAAPAEAPVTAPAPVSSGKQTLRWTGYALTAAGAVSVGIGGYFGVTAFSKRSDSDKVCSGDTCPTVTGVQANNDAKAAARVADVLIGAGIAAVAAGVLLVITARERKPASAAVHRGVTLSAAPGVLTGTF